MLKMKFKFKYAILERNRNAFWPVFNKSLEKFKKISGSISGKVKKIEAQAKLWFSYKKNV